MEVLFVQRSDFAVCVVPRARTVQSERDGAVSQYREFVVQQRKRGALFDAGRQNTDALQTVFVAQPNVVRTRAAGPYTQTDAAPYAAIVGCTPRDRAIYRFIIEELGPPAALGSSIFRLMISMN